MPLYVRIILAVVILGSLLAIFVVSFILYRKTPAPKGCVPTEEQCKACNVKGCRANIYADRNDNKEDKE